MKSQEVELVVEGLDALAAPGLDGPFLTPFWLVSRLVPPVGDSDRLIELCDLVSVLCGSRDLDRTCPVEIEVAESESEVLDVYL